MKEYHLCIFVSVSASNFLHADNEGTQLKFWITAQLFPCGKGTPIHVMLIWFSICFHMAGFTCVQGL
jgi:hypothetical protein